MIFVHTAPILQSLPLWITQGAASAARGGVCAGKIPPNVMLEKRFGIDSILERVAKEELMLPKDFQRLLATIDKAYLGTVPAEDKRRVVLQGYHHNDLLFPSQLWLGRLGFWAAMFLFSSVQE